MVSGSQLEFNWRLWEYGCLCLYAWPSSHYGSTLSLLTCHAGFPGGYSGHHLLFVVLALRSVARRGSDAYTCLSWRWVSYGQSRDYLYGGRGHGWNGQSGCVSCGRRWWWLVWPESVMSCMGEDDCWLWYKLMAFSRTHTLIYIGLVALLDRIIKLL